MSKFVKIFMSLALAAMCAVALTACGVNINSIGLPTELALDKGETELLAVEYGAEDEATEEKIAEAAAKLTLEWTSSDESVATVGQDGLVTAVGAGTANITVSIKDANIQSVCAVTVSVPLEDIQTDESLALVINGQDSASLNTTLKPADATDVELKYETSDPAVATVDSSGAVVAVGNGECTVTVSATSSNGAVITKDVAVKVDTAPTGISAEDISMTIGGSATVNAVVEGENITVGSELTYVSKDPAIATVDENGKVSSVAVGSTQITVSNSAGQTTDIAVTVKQVVCAYCGQEGHGSGSCPKKAADEEAARVAAQQQAAAAAAAGGAGGAAGGAGGAGGSSGGSSGGEHWTDATGRDNYVIIEDGSAPSNANGSGSQTPLL